MRLSPKAEIILSEIISIGAERKLALGDRLRVPVPDINAFYALCELLASSPAEENLQKFIEKNPGFITGLAGGPDNVDLAVLVKPPIGNAFRADFCVLQAHQGGSVAHLIEIESCHERLFTKQGRPSKRLSGAITQIEDWNMWIERSKLHYARELIDKATKLPLYDAADYDGRGFILTSPDNLRYIWKQFGGEDDPMFIYTIIIGRWSQLSQTDKARILNRNRQSMLSYRIYTYEQLARNANFRLERDDWFNESDSWGSENPSFDDLT